ncbi:EF-hand calcium-binding domain-containing protein 4B isoform X2 [Heterodontus francisci]|uniref:EF-hand calcium-binding domain-containing protein 4B isoform X2 n=1 Tax=Heterodontus francisci TaxID=7792 RepID=UPI00355BA56B
MEDDNGLSAQRDLELVDWNRAEIRSSGQLALKEKAQEFFQICDREAKGFINQRDMQHLQTELPLSSDELQNTFDALDTDGNGYLTLEEFTTGFSQFLFGEKIIVNEINKGQEKHETPYQNRWPRQLTTPDDDEERQFHLLMDNLGAMNLFKDQREIRNLWTQLRKDDPHLLTNFEVFLEKVSIQIQEANEEKEIIEFALKRKAAEYSEEIKHLYDEMEQQIRKEKDSMLNKDSESRSQCQELEYLLRVKEQEQDQCIQKQNRLERRCVELLSEVQESKIENQRLNEINEELKQDLQKASDDLLYAQHQVQVLQEETFHLREEGEMELYRVTESLEREKLSLRKQLDLLREKNKHLRDERDRSLASFQKTSIPGFSSFQIHRTMAVNDQYTGSRVLSNRKGSNCEDLSSSEPFSKNLEHASGHSHIRKETNKESEAKIKQRLYLQRIISIEEDPLPQFLEMHSTTHLENWIEMNEEEEELEQEKKSQGTEKVLSPPRREPVGKEALTQDSELHSNPDRLFKIIFVGNSSVGKSSILRRFCGNSFCPGMCATVGIDYHVKTVNVDNCLLALQLWDTAGQERFRSVTKQFFRKADGVVLIYDITAAMTFRAVRQWLESVQECNLIFYECSASSGVNITESMMHLARLLKELEDQEREKTVKLGEDSPQQKTCCAK